MNQLNLLAKAIGSKTVIFFLSIFRRPDSFKSPNNLVIVTLVDPIASAIDWWDNFRSIVIPFSPATPKSLHITIRKLTSLDDISL